MGERDAQQPGGCAAKDVGICRLADMTAGQPLAGGPQIAELDTIFFASSNVQHFADDAARAAFRERWLGRYLEHWAQDFFVACSPDRRVIGYLAGCIEDPATHAAFADLDYASAFADLSRSYPAHLHINLDPGWRNGGIGARLIDAFCAHAEKRAAGVHVVTGRQSRNVRFYERNGFRLLRTMRSPGGETEIAFLGRPLGSAASI
jgi:GNAT superfamily N-acetyltransferase